jgi:hypothetical protein
MEVEKERMIRKGRKNWNEEMKDEGRQRRKENGREEDR